MIENKNKNQNIDLLDLFYMISLCRLHLNENLVYVNGDNS